MSFQITYKLCPMQYIQKTWSNLSQCWKCDCYDGYERWKIHPQGGPMTFDYIWCNMKLYWTTLIILNHSLIMFYVPYDIAEYIHYA